MSGHLDKPGFDQFIELFMLRSQRGGLRFNCVERFCYCLLFASIVLYDEASSIVLKVDMRNGGPSEAIPKLHASHEMQQVIAVHALHRQERLHCAQDRRLRLASTDTSNPRTVLGYRNISLFILVVC